MGDFEVCTCSNGDQRGPTKSNCGLTDMMAMDRANLIASGKNQNMQNSIKMY